MASKAFLTSWRYITCSLKPTPGLKATSNDEPGAQRVLYLGRLCLQVIEVTSTSLGMAMHTAWPACPLNTLEWNIPHYFYHNLGHHWRIMYITGKWWPIAHQITSLTHKTVFTTSTYCTHSEGWGPREKWMFQISLRFKGIYLLVSNLFLFKFLEMERLSHTEYFMCFCNV